jgi:aspartate kinase/aspartokinase/homoserine dehydrogenase 1
MSDKIIRLGGSHAGRGSSLKNLITHLGKGNGKSFIVVSAIPEMLELIKSSLYLANQTDSALLSEKLNAFHTATTGKNPSESFLELVCQVTGIIRGVALIGDYSEGLKDQVFSFAEKLTVEIFKTQLAALGLEAEVLYPEQIDLQVTSDYGNATFLSVNRKKTEQLAGNYFLIPGTYGITRNGKIARTGTTAADYTAAFLTRELEIPKLELWGLDKEFYRVDPAIVSGVDRIGRLTYSEASELAYFDHYSFHPRTVEPLESEHIPIYIINPESENGKIDTVINTETFIEPQVVKSVAYTDDISLLRLEGPGVGLKPGILAKVTSQLNKADINIRSVITSQISINIILEKKTGSKALDLIRKLGFSSVKDVAVIDNVTLVGVVGHGMQQNYGVAAKIFSAVARQLINVELSGSGASDLVSYLVVRSSDKEKSIREIYNSFFNPNR